MRHLALLTCVLSPAFVSAQGVVPPYEVVEVNPLPGLSPGPIPGNQVQQVCLVHFPGNPPNIYYCALTVYGLGSANGGVGGSDLLTGDYDVLTDTFTPNNEAAGLNTTGTEFGLQIHHSGLYAVFDRLPGLPRFARRSAIGQPWVEVGPISPLPTQSYYDPSLADYHGQTWLLHVLGNDIAMTPIDTTTGATLGLSIPIVQAAQAGSTANSPTPILDQAGNLIGVSHHDVLGSDNDHYLSLDLDPATPAVLMKDTTTWINNGDYAAGRFFDAEYSAGYHVFSMETYWTPGGRARVGGTMTVDFYTPQTNAQQVLLSALLVGIRYLPAGVPLPGAQGLLGIAPQGAMWFGLFPQNNQTGSYTMTIRIPNNSALSGTRLAAQMAVFDALSSAITLANTAALVIE
ncbi:MAG: hypothetical protein Fur0037_02130 [Planctomycetota bacterium]